MAQYKHSRFANLKIPGPEPHARTFSGTMVTFIFALLFMFVLAGIISLLSTYTNVTPDRVSDSGAVMLSDELVSGKLLSDHIPEGWTFVPNVTPETVKTSLNNATSYSTDGDVSHWPSTVLLNHRPYLEGVTISDSWQGWFD